MTKNNLTSETFISTLLKQTSHTNRSDLKRTDLKVALVTGGTAGIGAAISTALSIAGYSVAANYRSHGEAAKEFSKNTSIKTFAWDVCDYASCVAGVTLVQDSFGPIDLLVNNAGITRDVMLHNMSPEQWREVIDTDLTSCFNMCSCVIRGMRERRYGRIINISSINALSGQAGQTNYSAAKAGIIGFTKSLALESASRNITVNVIAPGYTDTAMVSAVPANVMENILKKIPVGRLNTPEEVASCVVFLASDDAKVITGTTLSVNGGMHLN